LRITGVDVLNLSCRLEEPLRWSTGTALYRNSVIVRLSTDEGVTGFGEADSELAHRALAPTIEQELKPLLIGRDPFDSDRIWEDYFSHAMSAMRLKGLLINAISAVDIALWDIKGKGLGRPVYQLLGGACLDRIPAYATGLYFKDIRSLCDEASTYLERGFTAMKLKIGNGLEKDEDIVRAVRDTTGGDTTLMVDANGRYSAKSAIKVGRILERYDVYWFEEPVPSEDIDGYRQVRSALDVAIAGGECEYTRYGFRDLISTRAVDIVQPDCTRAGGITECKKIGSMASAWNISYAPHVWGSAVGFAAALQLSCNLRNLAFFEYDQTPNPLRDELAIEPFQFKKGFIELPKAPGLGLELNEQVIHRYGSG